MIVPKAKKLPSGTWFIYLRLGGEKIPVTAYTEKECIRQAELAKAEYRAGKRKPAGTENDLTLSQAIDRYISARENIWSPSTIRTYRIIQKNRFSSIMNKKISTIASGEWQSILNKESQKFSPKTVKNSWRFLRSVINDATGSFPPEVNVPKPIIGKKPFLTPEQILIFVESVKGTKYEVPCLLALNSLRISEIEALQWQDIPENPKFISVSGAVVLDENNEKVRKRKNKTSASTRDVPIMIPELLEAIKRERQPTGSVMPYHQETLRRAIKRICEKDGLPNVGIHGLRRSFASLGYYLQMPERIIMDIGGWDDPQTMHKIYIHISKSDVNRYGDEMARFYQNRKNVNENVNEK